MSKNFLMKNNSVIGIMFHHFHNKKKFLKGQGSISGNKLIKIIKYIGKKNILNPSNIETFLKKKNGKIKYVLTFDDGLKCQIDIALKILKKHNIKGIFFIFSSILTSKPDLLEVYRDFRNVCFKNIEHFYFSFFNSISKNYLKKLDIFYKKKLDFIKKIKKNSPYYTYNDIKFRVLRDNILKKNYKTIMLKMFKKYNYNYKAKIKDLYMNAQDIIKLETQGHFIGLHSHNHQSNLFLLNQRLQTKEYKKNKRILEKYLKNKILFASYPFGNYNLKSIKALKHNKIKFAFCKNMLKHKTSNNLFLKLPRENHSDLIRKI